MNENSIGGEKMKIAIECDAKEIAALVVAVQEQPVKFAKIDNILDGIQNGFASEFYFTKSFSKTEHT